MQGTFQCEKSKLENFKIDQQSTLLLSNFELMAAALWAGDPFIFDANHPSMQATQARKNFKIGPPRHHFMVVCFFEVLAPTVWAGEPSTYWCKASFYARNLR